MIIRFLGQSGYVLETKNSRILIDPYLSDSVNRLVGRPRLLPIPIHPRDIVCDAVICTHNHADHLDPDTVLQVSDGQFFLTTNEGKKRLRELGKRNVQALSLNETVTVGDFTLTAVFAKHTVEAFGLVVKAEGKTLYFSGDTLFDAQLFTIAEYRPDATFICINGRLGNMNAEEALTVANKIGAPINIPNHYDMFASNGADPHLFADHIPGGFIMAFNKPYRFTENSTLELLRIDKK
ncbi:MAG: MBL fold metallo-hydrolase [Oscillospiraceae bacterium]|nr:MBL fold metallo-hydrolase [Oscillospiraceae bacterium]MBQ7330084.1 MBL fold metallo-hydrolase [Oscillospiraceae bacterium]